MPSREQTESSGNHYRETIVYSGTVHEAITLESESACIEVFNVCCAKNKVFGLKWRTQCSFDVLQQAKSEKNMFTLMLTETSFNRVSEGGKNTNI